MSEDSFEQVVEDRDPLGPKAVLVCGLDDTECSTVTSLLGELELVNHVLVRCTAEMVSLTLEQALDSPGGQRPATANELPRTVVLSGMHGAAVRGFLDLYKDSGHPKPIFAAATSESLQYPLRDLLRILLAERQALSQ